MSTEFKSTLPPRKRAKTKEEKEQRRVERILRNRRAAHASREKKRKHVEYLESYVLKLEANLEKSQGNFSRLSELSSAEMIQKANVVDLDDLLQLKEKIHLNLNCTSVDDESDTTDGSVKVKIEASPDHIPNVAVPNVSSTTATTTTPPYEKVSMKKRKLLDVSLSDNGDLLSVSVSPDNAYYNYLSPISMNSPVNSPIDLTLKTEDLPPLTLDTSSPDLEISKGFNILGQNSEVILSPRNYDSGLSIASY